MRMTGLLALALFWSFLLSCDDQHRARSATIDIGFVALPFVSTLDTYCGLMSAQQEANAVHAFGPNLTLNITFIPGISLVNSTAEIVGYYATHVLFGRTNYAGFVMPSYTNSDALFAVMQKFNVKKPIFGPDALSNTMSLPAAQNVVNYKPPPSAESFQALNFAIHSYMHCTNFVFFRINFTVLQTVSAAMAAELRHIGLRVKEAVFEQDGPDPFSSPLNAAKIRDVYFGWARARSFTQ